MYAKASRTSHLVLTALCLSLWAGIWAFAENHNRGDFEYWGYLDQQNLELQHILTLPNEEWSALDENKYRVTVLDSEFWQLADHPILWIKIQIPRRIKDNRLWLELVPNTGVDGLLVQRFDDHWQWIPAEGRRADDEDALPTNFLTFGLDPTIEHKTAYLKLNTTQVFNFSLNIYDHAEWTWESIFRHIITGMVLGAVALAFCYNLAVGVSAGERIYLIYAAYVASMFLYIVIYNGYLRVLFPDWGGQGVVARSSVYVTMYCAIAFIREFFNMRYVGGYMEYFARGLQYVIILCLMTSLFINDFHAFLLSDATAVLAVILGLLAGLQALMRGHPLAKLFLLAWSIFLSGGLAWSLVWIGVTEPTTLPSNLLLLGTAFEVALLSLILSYRYSYLKETSEKLSKQYQKYQNLSETDELTGIYNRRGFFRAVGRELDKNPTEVVWLVLDIDHFKRFNDQHGHLVGDKLLAEFGNLLKERSEREEFTSRLVIQRSGELYRRSIVGRMGGEEFAILLVNTSLNQARLYADRLMKEFEDLNVTNDRGEKINTTLSIGGVALRSNDSIDSAWKRADSKLYEAKASGRNCAIIEE